MDAQQWTNGFADGIGLEAPNQSRVDELRRPSDEEPRWESGVG